jgi:hypothetical protein
MLPMPMTRSKRWVGPLCGTGAVPLCVDPPSTTPRLCTLTPPSIMSRLALDEPRPLANAPPLVASPSNSWSHVESKTSSFHKEFRYSRASENCPLHHCHPFWHGIWPELAGLMRWWLGFCGWGEESGRTVGE